jgi:hypothetical protein
VAGIEIDSFTLNLHTMMTEALMLFIGAIMSINTSSNLQPTATQIEKGKTETTVAASAPQCAERKRGGWDGN